MSSFERGWIVCQIGAREHYALAAALHERRRLAALCTDIWAAPGTFWDTTASLPGTRAAQLRGRYEGRLATARVVAQSPSRVVAGALSDRLTAAKGWTTHMRSNRRFGSWAARRLIALGLLGPKAVRQPAVFAYSYGALEILQVARQAGCPTVLGQIDPGPEEDELVAKIAARHGLARDASGRPPAQYWDRWRTECALADVVLVNSRWSADLVAQAGVDPKKIQVCPLAYEHHDATQPIRQYPKSFSPDRPLRVLFLGQAGVRKGTLELLEAMSRLKDVPVHLTIVGPAERPVLSRLVGLPQVDWKPQVPRSQVSACYQDADVFILPTHSDGFALTQLEAQAQALPLIASRFCGDVVQDGDSGYLLEAVSPDAIAAMLRRIIAYPCALQAMSDRAPLRASAFTSARAVDILEGALDVRGL